jgi:predicted nucleotidyltransferase
VEGSFADGSAMAASDLDLAIVFRGRFETGEFDEARKLAAGCRSHESLELDVGVNDEPTALRSTSGPRRWWERS